MCDGILEMCARLVEGWGYV